MPVLAKLPVISIGLCSTLALSPLPRLGIMQKGRILPVKLKSRAIGFNKELQIPTKMFRKFNLIGIACLVDAFSGESMLGRKPTTVAKS